MENVFKMKFPQKIDMFQVPEYISQIERCLDASKIIFDLSETIDVHSSFMGFLLVIRKKIENKGGQLHVEMSPYLCRVMEMLGMADYFSPGCRVRPGSRDEDQTSDPARTGC